MGQPTTGLYFNRTIPAAPAGEQNIVFQTDNATPQQSVTAYDPTMVGDTGSGGVGGNVPAPPAGSAAAGKFLKADGTFAVPGFTIAGTTTTGEVEIDTASPSGKALVVKASVSQTADLAEFQDSTGAVLSTVNNVGQFVLAQTSGAPTSTPSVGACAFDPATNTLWVYATAGWKSVVLT